MKHIKRLESPLLIYGIKGKALNWIHAFLGNRSQSVVLEGEESDSDPVTSGFVLGSILFLIYINDLPDQIVSHVRLFVDDTAICLTMEGSDSRRVLQNDIDSLSSWESRCDMEFYPSKCQVVRVMTSRRPINTLYYLHGQVLEAVISARYLGWTSLAACRGTPI